MKNFLRPVLTVAFLGMFIPTTLGATPVGDPLDGFVQTADPEWAPSHATSVDVVGHRDYHRDGEQEHLLWHQEHAAEQGSHEYVVAHRVMHTERNALHRQFHDMTGNTESAVPFAVPSTIAAEDGNVSVVLYHRYIGNRPSRRQLYRSVLARGTRN